MELELLEKLTQVGSPSGRETEIRALIQKMAEPYADDIRTDTLGNLIVHKKGNGKKLLFAAHMDEIGVMVTYVDEKGFARFANIGGLNTRELVGEKVRFADGTVGVIGSEEEAFKKNPALSKLYIDTGTKSREESRIKPGDSGIFIGGFYDMGDRIISKALDNRIGCFVLLETLKQIESSPNDLYFVFTVQEEVGLRGAKTAAFGIEPDLAVAVDVTDTGDTPEAEPMAVSLGGGAAIKVKDSSILCHAKVRTLLMELAKKNDISYQLEVLTAGGTDAGAIHLTKSGVPTGSISIPCRYLHSVSEMVDKKDVADCVSLLTALCQTKVD
jgi:putative aminopeptidase FrvX